MDRLGVMNRLYFDPRQPRSFGGLPYLKGDVTSWLIYLEKMRKLSTDVLDIVLGVGRHLLKGFTIYGKQTSWICSHNDGVKFFLT